eukprot:scaffold3077_cov162-Amphora_coffeaeformis.AAC.3
MNNTLGHIDEPSLQLRVRILGKSLSPIPKKRDHITKESNSRQGCTIVVFGTLVKMVLDSVGLVGEDVVKEPLHWPKTSAQTLSADPRVVHSIPQRTGTRTPNNMADNSEDSNLPDADPPARPISIGWLGKDTDGAGSVMAKMSTLKRQDSLNESSRGNPPVVPSTHKNTMNLPVVNDNHDVGVSTESSTSDKPASLKRQVSALEIGKTEGTVSPTIHKRPRISTPPVPIAPKPQQTILLARRTDAVALSPLHVLVRQQIEVFTATERDITQPAPGRKNPVSLHQIGLRCIHCRDMAIKQKVKRAVCYPSSVGRVYHTVSDMKSDHFKACPGIPEDLRRRFLELKDDKTKGDKKLPSKVTGCSSSTAQYYHDTACEMGMADGNGGVFWSDRVQKSVPKADIGSLSSMLLSQQLIAQLGICHQLSLPGHLSSALRRQQDFFQRAQSRQYAFSLLAAANKKDTNTVASPSASSEGQAPKAEPLSSQHSSWVIACPTDSQYLNPIHCFVRRHVEFFVAGQEEVNAPSPGRKTRVTLGQVGIRCIHCAHLPIKDRVKRSSCYPPSIGGLYHAISNMKCDHFALCKGLPPADREEFLSLRVQTSRKTPKHAKPKHAKPAADRSIANSTAQYYHDSAMRMGLFDTNDGIRLGTRDASDASAGSGTPKSAVSVSPTVPDGIAALVIAATDLVSAVDDGESKSLPGKKDGNNLVKEEV